MPVKTEAFQNADKLIGKSDGCVPNVELYTSLLLAKDRAKTQTETRRIKYKVHFTRFYSTEMDEMLARKVHGDENNGGERVCSSSCTKMKLQYITHQ